MYFLMVKGQNVVFSSSAVPVSLGFFASPYKLKLNVGTPLEKFVKLLDLILRIPEVGMGNSLKIKGIPFSVVKIFKS